MIGHNFPLARTPSVVASDVRQTRTSEAGAKATRTQNNSQESLSPGNRRQSQAQTWVTTIKINFIISFGLNLRASCLYPPSLPPVSSQTDRHHRPIPDELPAPVGENYSYEHRRGDKLIMCIHTNKIGAGQLQGIRKALPIGGTLAFRTNCC